jgi:hypothetical protein
VNAKEPADQAEQLREHAERTREALGDTMQKLSDKLDVQARANEGVHKVGAKAQQAAELAADKAQQAAELAADKAQRAAAQAKDTAIRTLDQAERKIDELPETVREPAHRTMDVLRQRPGLVLLGVAGLVMLFRLLTRRSHR